MDNLNMNSSDQDYDLPAGFLIKDKSGQFKKVQDDVITDFSLKKPVLEASLQPAKASVPPIRQSFSSQGGAAPARAVSPVKPPPPISSAPTASIFMAPDDELEIREQQEKLNQMMAAPAGHSVLSVEDVVNKAVSDFQLRFDEDIMQKRFAKVIESRLRDLRDSVETKEVLTRSKKIGGLELSPDLAGKILSFVEQHITDKPVIKPVELVKPASVRFDIPPAFIPRPQPVAAPMKPAEPIKEDVNKLAEEIKKEFQAPVPSPKPDLAAPAPQVPKPETPAAPSAPVSTPEMYTRPQDEMPRIVQVRKPEIERPQVIDIRQPAKVMGPVEELADLDLDEFRRQGTNPTEAAERILEKIDLLEHDSWAMKIDATKAWRRSPANQLYLQIGQESMESNQTVAETIRRRMQNNQPYLLLDEFLAINSLNSRLAI